MSDYLNGIVTETFTAGATGTTYRIINRDIKYYTVQIKGTGAAATAWNVVLEGSLDATNFDTILTHTEATGDGKALHTGANAYNFIHFRLRCASITLGSATNIVATSFGQT